MSHVYFYSPYLLKKPTMRKALRDITGNKAIVLFYFLLFVLLLITSFTAIKDTVKIGKAYDRLIDTSIYKIRLMRDNRLAVEQIQSFTIDTVFHPSSLSSGTS